MSSQVTQTDITHGQTFTRTNTVNTQPQQQHRAIFFSYIKVN